jgi:hypothetical protein
MSSNFMIDVETMLRKSLLALWNYPISCIILKDRDLIQISDEQLDFFLTNRIMLICMLSEKQKAGSDFDHIARFISDMVIDYLNAKNQFLTVGEEDRLKLLSICESLLNSLRKILESFDNRDKIKNAIEMYLLKHLTDLGNFIVELYHQLGYDDSVYTLFPETICAEYSPELQLNILGINDASDLLEPVLDIGCGIQGTLVKYLNGLAISTYGIDRNAPEENKVFRMDWFDIPRQPELWGTIISHMAFSLHFINHHFRINGQPEKFAHSYMNILHSLKKGGRFLYAPGLPFMEEHLPSSVFFVEKKEIRMENIYLSAKYQNMDMFYATVVEKMETR